MADSHASSSSSAVDADAVTTLPLPAAFTGSLVIADGGRANPDRSRLARDAPTYHCDGSTHVDVQMKAGTPTAGCSDVRSGHGAVCPADNREAVLADAGITSVFAEKVQAMRSIGAHMASGSELAFSEGRALTLIV